MGPLQDRRRVVLTWRQWLAIPFMIGLPALALAGVFGRSRAGAALRMAFVYVFVLLWFRLLGKRELSHMSPFEIVTLFFIPQLFRNAIVRNDDSMLSAIVSSTTLFLLVFATSLLSFRSRGVAVLLKAEPTVLVRNGVMLEDACNRERITQDDIESAAHLAGLTDVSQIRLAILEGNGEIAVIPMSRESEHVTPQ